MWTLLVATALAGDAIDGVSWAFQRGAPPQFVTSCAPLGTVLDFGKLIPLPASVTQEAAKDASLRYALGLLDRNAASAAGLDTAGTLVFSTDNLKDDDAMVGSIPFAGTHADATKLLQQLITDRAVTETPRGWEIAAKAPSGSSTAGASAKPPGVVTLDGGRLVFGSAAHGTPAAPPAGLLDGMPRVPGCAVYMQIDKDDAKVPLHFTTALFVPLEGKAPLTWRFRPNTPAPATFEHASVLPKVGSGKDTPAGVLIIGVTLDDLLSAVPKLASESHADLDKIRKQIRVDGGAVVAIFGDPRQMNFTAVLPITDAKGHPIPKGRMVKAIVKEGKAKRTSGSTFEFTAKNRTIYGAAGKGVLVFGTSADGVADAAAGRGTPWITPAMADYAKDWPIALVAGGNGKPDVRAGIHARDGVWEAQFSVTGAGTSPQLAASMVGMAAGAAAASFGQFQNKASRAEVENNVRGIATAEMAYDAAFDGYLAVPVAPRAKDALTKESVAWGEQNEWRTLGWQPDGNVRGCYWVELAADGAATVHGMIDADGNGVPAHYVQVVGVDSAPHPLTANDVY